MASGRWYVPVPASYRVDSNTKSISSLLVLMVARESDTRERLVYCAKLLINDVLPVPVAASDFVTCSRSTCLGDHAAAGPACTGIPAAQTCQCGS